MFKTVYNKTCSEQKFVSDRQDKDRDKTDQPDTILENPRGGRVRKGGQERRENKKREAGEPG